MWRVLVLALTGLVTVGCMPTEEVSQTTLPETTETPLQKQLDEEARLTVAQANNAFGIELYKVLSSGNSSANLVMSPLSASAALALTWLGTAGQTASQLGTALHLPDDRQRVATGYKALVDTLQTSDGVEVSVANKLFVQENFPVKDSYRQTAVNYFRSDSQQVNFNQANEEAHKIINDWVDEATKGKIKNLFPRNTISKDAVLVLVNAIYLKGEWLKAFRENETQNEPFNLADNSQVNVPMMNGVIQTGYMRLREGDCTIMELPYKGSSMRMLIILPNKVDGLHQLEQSLSQINFNDLSLYTTELRIKLPKFKIESKLLLKKMMKRLGVQDLFNEKANLTELSDAPHLKVSKVLQKAIIEVNEKGTVAAAATAVETISRSGRIVRDFYVDRPFLFVLQGVDGNILFMGRVSNPIAV